MLNEIDAFVESEKQTTTPKITLLPFEQRAQKEVLIRPQTRIEVEYVNNSYVKDIAKWGKDAKIDVNTFSDIIKKNEKATPEFIMEDLSKILLKIFMILGVDGNRGEIFVEDPKIIEKPQKDAEAPSETMEKKFEKMRKFHNGIKTQLISYTRSQMRANTNVKLLDIAVGKGGDMSKWNNAGIKEVYGIDPDEKSIIDAKTRYNNMKMRGTNYTFEHKLFSDDSTIINNNYYDIVSCQFALHYMFVDQEYLDKTVKKISDALKPGGYFIGATLIGSRIKEYNNKYPELTVTKHDTYYELKYDDDSIYKTTAKEYYVDINVLKKTCGKHSLQIFDYKDFRDYAGFNELSPYEKAVSNLNATFIFEKI
jgi:mRNA (guanine-N7-)-methyltransferase